MDWARTLQEPKFWLLAIAAAIAGIHLSLLGHTNDSELFATCLLFWFAAGSLLWDERQSLKLESSWPSTLVGFLLLTFILIRSTFLPNSFSTACVFPFVAVLGVSLMAAGAKSLGIFWKQLVIFGVLASYPLLKILLRVINLSKLTAMAAHFNLLYLGFPVQRDGVFLIMPPTSSVQVYEGCSGTQSILQLLSLAILFLLMFPLRSQLQKVFCVISAIAIAFIVNAIRVSLMAILNNAGNKSAFDYWHDGNGSLIFSAIAVLIFGLFCWFFFLRTPSQPGSSGADGNA